MKRWKLIAVVLAILAGLLASTSVPLSGRVLAEGGPQYKLPVMRPDPDTIRDWIELYNSAPQAHISPAVKARVTQPPGESFSLLDHLEYDPADRNQGSCGNCWV